MIPAATDQVLEALKRLSESQDGQVIKAWLKQGKEFARDRLEQERGDEYRITQGHAQILTEILSRIEGAKEAIARKQSSGNR